MFDVPGAGSGQFQGTAALNINPGGVIAGYWADPDDVYHGFVRHAEARHIERSTPQARALDPVRAP